MNAGGTREVLVVLDMAEVFAKVPGWVQQKAAWIAMPPDGLQPLADVVLVVDVAGQGATRALARAIQITPAGFALELRDVEPLEALIDRVERGEGSAPARHAAPDRPTAPESVSGHDEDGIFIDAPAGEGTDPGVPRALGSVNEPPIGAEQRTEPARLDSVPPSGDTSSEDDIAET